MAGIPRDFHGDVLEPSPCHEREPSDPPVRFVDRDGEGGGEGEPRCANTRKVRSTDTDGTEHRVAPSRYDEGLIAPPSVDTERLPSPFVVCGCGTCETTIFEEADCPRSRPATRGEARAIYRAIAGTNMNESGTTSKVDLARQRYARLRDGDAFLRLEYEGLTTVLLSLRLSPVDENGRVVTPYQLCEDLYANVDAVINSIRYELGRKYGFDYEYVRLTSGTVGWSTPHLHLHLWVEDPNDAVDAEMFRPAVTKHVERCSRAGWNAHGVVDDGTVRVEHSPLIATEIDDCPDSYDGLRDVQGTRGAIYLGSQLPHFALEGGTKPWEIDRAVAAWVSPRRWFQPSRGFPSGEDAQKLKQSDER